jgi:hypothetical protein
MKAATFHNTMLTLVSGYAEALAELEAQRAEAVQTLDLARRATPVSPRALSASRRLLAFWDEKQAGQREGADPAVLFEELRAALAEMGA